MALFKTFGMQNGDKLKFFLRSFRKVIFRKMQFLKDGVQTVILAHRVQYGHGVGQSGFLLIYLKLPSGLNVRVIYTPLYPNCI